MEGSTLLVGICSEESGGARMSHGTAWGDGHPTFPGGWLDSVSLGTVSDH